MTTRTVADPTVGSSLARESGRVHRDLPRAAVSDERERFVSRDIGVEGVRRGPRCGCSRLQQGGPGVHEACLMHVAWEQPCSVGIRVLQAPPATSDSEQASCRGNLPRAAEPRVHAVSMTRTPPKRTGSARGELCVSRLRLCSHVATDAEAECQRVRTRYPPARPRDLVVFAATTATAALRSMPERQVEFQGKRMRSGDF